MKTGFYTEDELEDLGLKSYGEGVRISRKVSIFAPEKVKIGNNVRIDDFCILSGEIKIGSNVHISAGVYLYGKYGIEIKDYAGCSAQSVIYSETDDFSGEHMIGAVLPEEVTGVISGKVVLEKYAQLGVKSVVMPGVTVGEGAVTGAFSFVKEDLAPWTINVGVPTKTIRERSKMMLGGGNRTKLYKRYYAVPSFRVFFNVEQGGLLCKIRG